ncbi:MAG: ankyrin repeat domain-containing protein, partial [Synechococcus sp. SB0678_bin_12]|nr:ankyrin repeat domain-containing protein [Synechococcus sp. SB0678_bin_12]
MLNLPQKSWLAPVTLSLATVLAFILPLTTACSGRGQQASSPPAQATETPQQEPAEQGTGNGNGVDPAQPLLATESSPPAPSRLHRAAMAGDVEQVKQLLEQGHEIDQQHARGLSALHEAVSRGHGEVVQVFMEAGADPNDPTAQGETPLHLAAAIGSVEICNVLLGAGAELWFRDQDDLTPIGIAIQEGDVELVKLLADANVKRLSRPIINTANLVSPLRDALHLSAYSNNTEVMKILLENLYIWTREHYNSSGFFARKETILDGREKTEGNTPLHIAAYNGYTDIARLLVQ